MVDVGWFEDVTAEGNVYAFVYRVGIGDVYRADNHWGGINVVRVSDVVWKINLIRTDDVCWINNLSVSESYKDDETEQSDGFHFECIFSVKNLEL